MHISSMQQLPIVALYDVADSHDVTILHELIGGILAAAGQPPESATEVQPSTTATHLCPVRQVSLRTKYYTAEVGLCAVGPNGCAAGGGAELVERTGAVLLYFDGADVDALGRKWRSVEDDLAPGVKLALCQTLDANVADEVNAWCLENEFELIELEPSAETLESAAEYNEKTGYDRCVQALSANQWVNAVFTDGPQHGVQAATDAENIVSTESGAVVDDVPTATNAPMAAGGDDCTPAADACDRPPTESELDSLDELFEQFAEMKLRARLMNDQDRKRFAAEMALKFYAAMGGSESDDDGGSI